MEQFWLENQGSASYLVYVLAENDELDSMSLGMLTNNAIQGIAKTYYMQLDQERTLRYDVSAQIPLEQFYAGTVTRERLLKTFYSISEALTTAENYMIPLGNVMLEPNLIFVSVATCAVSLVCLPLAAKNTQALPLREFFRNIMFSAQFDQSENCDYISTLINYLNGTRNFSLQEFCQTLRKLMPDDKVKTALYTAEHGGEDKKSADKKVVIGHVAQPVPAAPTPRPSQQPFQSQPQPQIPSQIQQLPQIQQQQVQPQQQPAYIYQPKQKGKKQPRHQASAASPAVPGGPGVPQIQIPGRPPVPSAPAVQPTSEKSVSLFYLLQHYNKENAALYHAQKAQKKAEKSSKKPPKAGKNEQVTYTYQPKSPPVPEQIPAVVAAPQSSAAPAASQPPRQQPSAVPQASAVPSPGGAPPLGDFGNTSFYFLDGEDSGGTVILGQEQPTQQFSPHLIRKSNQEKIPIHKPVFRLGRDAGFNDYVVTNPAVGHSHCFIVTRDNEYFIVDSNSKNHTRVDGVIVPSGQEIKLTHGCAILLADEEFEFRLF